MPSDGGAPARARPSPVDELLTQAHGFVADWLARALPAADAPPRRLHAAMRDAVFPGGRRLRPLLCRLVADLYGAGDRELVGRFAAALELVHCASLVQVDLPCFDDAGIRRGTLACHVVYGKATAILVGDALLTLAFETLADAPSPDTSVAFRLMGLLAAATGGARGLILAQAQALGSPREGGAGGKGAALFAAAAVGGALLGGADGDVAAWARLGELIGDAPANRAAIGAALRELPGEPTRERAAIERLIGFATPSSRRASATPRG